MVIVFRQCILYFGSQKKAEVGKKAETEKKCVVAYTYFHRTTSEYAQKALEEHSKDGNNVGIQTVPGMGVGRIFFRVGTRGFFQNFSRGPNVKFDFSYSKLRKHPFLLKFSKSRGRPSPPSDVHVGR